ncbi:MAG: hypothetical protein AseanaTS_11300 [Candidatus Pelagadaptatus aseana]|uniref:hypothetical protein n=1 Tax=Candidatus Pelagadaptatus aseana TaxID=3120508 RepID=UPI0039B2A475
MENVLPFIGAKSHQDDAPAQQFLDRIHCITGIKLICLLTKAVQQHRGATMGYLSGEQAFLELAERQSGSIDQLFATYLQHNRFSETAPPPMEVSQSLDSWQVIKYDWQSDELLRNFEFHSHLIDGLKKLIRSSMREELLPVESEPKIDHYEQLLETVFITLPNTAEALAMLRGLSTNAAVVQACGSDSHMRLSFLIKDIPRLVMALERALDELEPDFPDVKALRPSKGLLRHLNALLRKINDKILNSRKIQEDSTQLFKVATDIVDAFWASMEQGISLIEQRLYSDLLSR